MKIALRNSEQRFMDKRDLLVIPFSGGTPSGDAVGTTDLNTNFSNFYEMMYFA